jgi:hypothetical protein
MLVLRMSTYTIASAMDAGTGAAAAGRGQSLVRCGVVPFRTPKTHRLAPIRPSRFGSANQRVATSTSGSRPFQLRKPPVLQLGCERGPKENLLRGLVPSVFRLVLGTWPWAHARSS